MHFRKYENLREEGYVNQYGEHKVDKAWSWELARVAQFGFI